MGLLYIAGQVIRGVVRLVEAGVLLLLRVSRRVLSYARL
jgi:hypothetical protein